MEDELPKISIKYIPTLENAINIFSKDALYYYFNEYWVLSFFIYSPNKYKITKRNTNISVIYQKLM